MKQPQHEAFQHDNHDRYRRPTLNLSLGPECPTACICNFRFDRHQQAPPIEAVLEFTRYARIQGIERVTLAGGDFLSYPDISILLCGLKEQGYFVQGDSPGRTLLDSSKVHFPPRTSSPNTDGIALRGIGRTLRYTNPDTILPYLDTFTLTLDEVASWPTHDHNGMRLRRFRHGWPTYVEDTQRLARIVHSYDTTLGANTVITRFNVEYLQQFTDAAYALGVKHHQLFQFDPYGGNQSQFVIDQYRVETAAIQNVVSQLPDYDGMDVEVKYLESRRDNYYMIINNGGDIWIPGPKGESEASYNIVRQPTQALHRLIRFIIERYADSLLAPPESNSPPKVR